MKTSKVDFAAQFIAKLDRLKRKYHRIDEEVEALVRKLQQGERPGNKIPRVGYDVYKVRLRNPSAGKGKRGGFRAVYYLRLAHTVVLLTIYAKSEQTDISIDALRLIIEAYQPPEEDSPQE